MSFYNIFLFLHIFTNYYTYGIIILILKFYEEVIIMKSLKKVLLVVIVLIILIILALILREYIILNPGNLDKSSPMSREEIVSLLDRGSNYTNYYFSPETINTKDSSYGTSETYIKDNVVVSYLNSELFTWENYNTNESLSFIKNDGKNYVGISHNLEKIPYSQHGVDYSTIAKPEYYGYTYKYLGEKEFDGRTSIVVELKSTNSAIRFTIDKETGIILSRQDVYKMFFITTHITTTNMNVKIDSVTDEDIVRPNLDGYTILEATSE